MLSGCVVCSFKEALWMFGMLWSMYGSPATESRKINFERKNRNVMLVERMVDYTYRKDVGQPSDRRTILVQLL